MMNFTAIFRQSTRRRAPRKGSRKRASHSFDSGLNALEARALLTTVSVAVATVASRTLISLPPQPTDPEGLAARPTDPHPLGSSSKPFNPLHPAGMSDHVGMDVAEVSVGGQMTPEFALADDDPSQVIARVGLHGPSMKLDSQDGIDHPQSVTLADLNDDGLPDLIVANSGSDNILIFPGLPGGLFGPEMNGGQGIPVGVSPVSVTVNYVDGDPGRAQLLVANEGSNSVTILNGQGGPDGWRPSTTSTIATPSGPVKALAEDVNGDGAPELFVCNSLANSVTMYPGVVGGDGEYDTSAGATQTFDVGMNPSEVFIGSFEHDHQLDMVTIDSGSNSLTFLGGVFGPRPTSQTFSSGGISPDAGFTIDPAQTGVLDLVVANGGDGHLAVFRGGAEGLQLAGVITQSGVTSPTALAPASSGGDGFDFFAAGVGNDAALLLHFDLGVASTYLPVILDGSESISQADSELFAQLMPMGESSLELVAVFWAGSPESEAFSGEYGLREPSTITALYSPTEGQGTVDREPTAEVSVDPPPAPAKLADPSKVDTSEPERYILGIAQSLERFRSPIEALAARDIEEGEFGRPIDGLARLDQDLGLDRELERDRDAETSSGAIDEALRLFWSGGSPRDGEVPVEPPSHSRTAPAAELEGIDTGSLEVRPESVPLISSALLVSTRLIFGASPPRPSMFRRKAAPRKFVSLGNDPKAGSSPEAV